MATDTAERLRRAYPQLDIRSDASTLTRYSRDGSVFLVEPAAVVLARDADDLAAAVNAAREFGLPVTARAGGSSVAGQCLGQGLVVDTSRLEWIEVEGNSVRCGPGVTLDRLNEALSGDGRQIGPDVTSSAWARVGGLVSTNACGSRSLLHGRFGDILKEARVVTPDGSLEVLRKGEIPAGLRSGLDDMLSQLGSALGNWPRQHRTYGGYRLDRLAEEKDALSLLPGSEGTLCLIAEATLATAALPEQRALSLVEHETLRAAVDDAQACVGTSASAVEVLDRHILEAVRQRGKHFPGGPETAAALLVEHLDEAVSAAGTLKDICRGRVRALSGDAAEQAWAARVEALKLTSAGGRFPVAIFEDIAVEGAELGDFCDALLELLQRLGFEALVYGHAAAGCLHVRPLCEPGDPDLVRRLAAAATAVSELVAEYGGAITGEHGWGLSRSYLAPQVLGPELYRCFQTVKRAFDPNGLFNPGLIVDGREPFSHFQPAL